MYTKEFKKTIIEHILLANQITLDRNKLLLLFIL